MRARLSILEDLTDAFVQVSSLGDYKGRDMSGDAALTGRPRLLSMLLLGASLYGWIVPGWAIVYWCAGV